MKHCPFCAEEIQDAAIVCKHCGRDLNPQPAARPSGGRQANKGEDRLYHVDRRDRLRAAVPWVVCQPVFTQPAIESHADTGGRNDSSDTRSGARR